MNIDVINSAWRLGHRPLPPIGAVVHLNGYSICGKETGYKIIGMWRSNGSWKITVFREPGVWKPGDDHRGEFTISLNDITEFVSLPRGTSPFETWTLPEHTHSGMP